MAHPLDNIGKEIEAASRGRGVDRRVRYEDSALRLLCRGEVGIGHLAVLRADARERGVTHLAFSRFEELIRPGIQLRVCRFATIAPLTLAEMFDRFSRTLLAKGLVEVFHEIDPRDGPVGMVFRWENAAQLKLKSSRYFVAHTLGGEVVGVNEGMIRTTVTFAKTPFRITIEPLPALGSRLF